MNQWHSSGPEPGTVAWVWVDTVEVLALWTGKAWMAQDDRRILRGVTHWRIA